MKAAPSLFLLALGACTTFRPQDDYSDPSHDLACANGVLDDLETDVDCGSRCSRCADGAMCHSAEDCQSAHCEDGRCMALSCSDGLSRGDETDVDCGGSCPPCPEGASCYDDVDCTSGFCSPDYVCVTLTCFGESPEGGETEIDCGGSCPPCALGSRCMKTGDCVTGVCSRGRCESTVGVWLEVSSPGPRPSPRQAHAMAYDATLGGALLFGGNGATALGDTWVYREGLWQVLPTATPGARGFATMVYDPALGVTILSGGVSPAGYLADSWSFRRGGWSPVGADGTPTGRIGVSAAYVGHDVVAFGGMDGVFHGDTWLFGVEGTWTDAAASGPSARFGAAMASDVALATSAVLFGGSPNGSHALDDTWLWNGSAWEELSPEARPTARLFAAMAHDSRRERAVVFGGVSEGGETALGDTWEFDGETWRRTSYEGPAARSGHRMVYDAARGVMVLFGGTAGGSTLFGDTWEYHTRGNACSTPSGCAFGHCVDGVCCDAESCGTCEACNLPESPGRCATVRGGPDSDTCQGQCDDVGSCKP